MNLCVLYLQKAVSPVSLQPYPGAACKGIRAATMCLSIGALEQLLEDHPFSMLPQCVLTERPDRAASFLAGGAGGHPHGWRAPGPGDAGELPARSSTPRRTRPCAGPTALSSAGDPPVRGALLTLLLPGLFVALVLFHPAALPVALLDLHPGKPGRRSPIDSRWKPS